MSEFVSCDQKFIDEKVIVHNPDEYSIFYDSITEDALLYFTGFTFKTFGLFLDAILNFQPSVSTTPNKFLAFPDVLIMSLTKFKHNYDFLLLRAMYGLSSGSLASIFKQMAEILYEYFSQLDFWSTRKFENGSYTILFFVLRIRIYKYIIALDSNSNVIYCSDLYPNVTAHKDIILKTNILDHVDIIKDIVMMDKSFSVQNILKERNISTSLPAKVAGTESNKTVYRVKQNRITIEQAKDIEGKEMLEKIVYTSNMLISYIDLA